MNSLMYYSKYKKEHDFYTKLAKRESSNRKDIVNKYGYMGLYQIGKYALLDTKYIDDKNEWTGKNNINSQEDFLKNAKIQKLAIKEYHKIIWEKYLKNHHKYIGVQIKDITLKKCGIIAGAHLVGQNKIKKFLDSNGEIEFLDGNNISVLEYIKTFNNCYINL